MKPSRTDYAMAKDKNADPIKVAKMFSSYTGQVRTQAELARAFNISESRLCTYLGLLKMPPRYIRMLKARRINMKIARAFVRRMDDNPFWEDHLEHFINKTLNGSDVEAYTALMRLYPLKRPPELIKMLREEESVEIEAVDLTIRSGAIQDCTRCGGKVLSHYGEEKCSMCGFVKAELAGAMY